MVTTECDHLKMVYSSGDKTIITDFSNGTIQMTVNDRTARLLSFEKMSLADYLKLRNEFISPEIVGVDTTD